MKDGMHFLRTHVNTLSHIHMHKGAPVSKCNHILEPRIHAHTAHTHTPTQRHVMQTGILSDKALSLDSQANFAAMYLSRPPCCHAAVVPSTHYLVSCDSISESFGPGSRTKREKKKTHSNR